MVGPKTSSGKNIKLVAPGESQISFDSRGLITHVDITISFLEIQLAHLN
jgi:hypothetical protein